MRATIAAALLLGLGACASPGPRPADPGAAAAASEDGCRPFFRAPFTEAEDRRTHSCWNRLWEVPAALVVVPVAVAVLVGVPTAPIWVPLFLL